LCYSYLWCNVLFLYKTFIKKVRRRPLFALSAGFVGGRWKAIVWPIWRVRRWPLKGHCLPYWEGSSVAVGRPIFTPPIEFVGNSWKAILPYPLYCRFLTYTPIQIAQSLSFSLSLNNLSNFSKLLYQYMYSVSIFSPLIMSCLPHLG
jgi:hypothetical protein